MSVKNLTDIIALLDSMDYNRIRELAFFAVGMLYGMTTLEEVEFKPTPAPETEEPK